MQYGRNGVVVRPPFLARAGLLGLVPQDDGADVGATAHGEDDLLGVRPGGVHLRLADLGDADAEPGQCFAERLLEVLGPVLVAVSRRIGHGRQRPSDVLGEAHREPGRHPPEPVVVVPGEDVPA
jgi:hypothetical protein